MAVLALTVGDIVDSVAFHLTNSTTIDSTLTAEIKKHLGWILYDLVVKSEMAAFRVDATLTLADGTSDYALPADFEKIIDPSMRFTTPDTGTIHYYQEQDRIAGEWQDRMSAEGKPLRYTIRDRDATTGLFQARFIPTPDATYGVAYTYFASPARVNEDTAAGTEIDPRYPRNLVSGLILGTALCFPQYLSGDQQGVYVAKYRETMSDLRKVGDPVSGVVRNRKRYRATDYRGGGGNSWDRTVHTGDPVR